MNKAFAHAKIFCPSELKTHNVTFFLLFFYKSEQISLNKIYVYYYVVKIDLSRKYIN